MCLQSFQQVMGKASATRVYQDCSISMLDPHVHARSIVVVLTPLTAIIQDQVMKSINQFIKSEVDRSLFPGGIFFIQGVRDWLHH